ncbi:hypothetical protein M8C21_016599, partial [Ambrosia artemisiifolia]
RTPDPVEQQVIPPAQAPNPYEKQVSPTRAPVMILGSGSNVDNPISSSERFELSSPDIGVQKATVTSQTEGDKNMLRIEDATNKRCHVIGSFEPRFFIKEHEV